MQALFVGLKHADMETLHEGLPHTHCYLSLRMLCSFSKKRCAVGTRCFTARVLFVSDERAVLQHIVCSTHVVMHMCADSSRFYPAMCGLNKRSTKQHACAAFLGAVSTRSFLQCAVQPWRK